MSDIPTPPSEAEQFRRATRLALEQMDVAIENALSWRDIADRLGKALKSVHDNEVCEDGCEIWEAVHAWEVARRG